MKKKQSEPVSGVLLFAKQAGITSFSSLWSIKHALGTDKVGHTGTLDSFADGLLVVLSGSLTHLVPHITGFRKTYQAVVCFGNATDTLDPCGQIVQTGTAPSREQVLEACAKLSGALLQVPPAYSAVHVGGRRASDMARGGRDVQLEPRQIFVYRNELLDFRAATAEDPCAYALLDICCSKGTYIRALARDMAAAMGTCAYLCALRRTSVGPFKLEDAACAGSLPPFTLDAGIVQKKRDDVSRKLEDAETVRDIQRHFMLFTPELAARCGFLSDILKEDAEKSYLNGRPLSGRMFTRLEIAPQDSEYCAPGKIAVFYADRQFGGMIHLQDGRLSYEFVVPHRKGGGTAFRTFTWQQLQQGDFPLAWKKAGTALTVGSFDGMHAGHAALVDAVLAQKERVGGIVTFASSFKQSAGGTAEELSSLRQRLDFCAQKGLVFAVVIDFSEDFSKIEGTDFIRTLADACNMRFLAEGNDFRCGYRGALTMQELPLLAAECGFTLCRIDDVLLEGERISSSRIRRAVQAADFVAARKMLRRSFAYDCTGLVWKRLPGTADAGVWFTAERVSRQELPPDGMYQCAVVTGTDSVHAVCEIAGSSVKLLLPETAAQVREIVF